MKRNIKKYIKDDIKQSYKFEYDKDQLLSDFVPKQKEKKVYQFTKLSIALHVAIICIIGIVIGGVIEGGKFHSNKYVSKEFKEYLMVEDFRIGSANLCYSLKISNGVNLHIYSFQKKEDSVNNYYYYVIQSKKEIKSCYIIINDKRTKVDEDSFGLISIKERKEDNQTLNFIIEIEGKTKEFVLN